MKNVWTDTGESWERVKGEFRGQSWPLLIFLCMLKLRPWSEQYCTGVNLRYNPSGPRKAEGWGR